MKRPTQFNKGRPAPLVGRRLHRRPTLVLALGALWLVALALVMTAISPRATEGTALALQTESDVLALLPMIVAPGTPPNQRPIANDDSYQTVEDTQLIVSATNGVLANDVDPENMPLQIMLVQDTLHGTFSLHQDGSFDYTPDLGYHGQDNFTYVISDGLANSNIAAVNIEVTEVGSLPPVAQDDQYQTLETIPLDVETADGILINDSSPQQTPLQATLVTNVANGTLSLNPDGSFDYLPNPGFSGQDSFTYQATDGVLGSNIATVTLTISKEDVPPPAANDDQYETPQDSPLIVEAAAGVLANDTDALQAPLTAILAGGPAHGALTLNSDGSFTYTPPAAYVGPDSFTYQATNGTTTSNTATVVLTVHAPGANVGPHFATGKDDFTKKVLDTKVGQVHSVNGADLDGDGDIDLVATDYVRGAVYWYANDGHGDFVTHVLDGNLPGAYPSHVGDVDGDGDADVLAGGYEADTFAWYRNDGGGKFTRINIDTRTNGAHSIVTSDLDQDGDVDLVTSSQDAGTIAWYKNNGANVFQRIIIDRTALGAKRAEVADIDSDGDLDIAVASYDNDQVAWLENDGNETFTKHVLPGKRDGAYYATPADVDGDGDVDILTASKLDNTIALYRNDGAENFTEEILDGKTVGARTVIAVDLDRDGDLDAIGTSRENDTIIWFVNDGSGHFTKRPIDLRADGAYGVETTDMDKDGDLDVLSASRSAGEVSVHTRTHSHVGELLAGGTLVIRTALLQVVDLNDSPAELTYTLTNAPDYGELRLDGQALGDGGTFTQADIDSGRLTYVHRGTYETADAFFFTVADGGEDGAQPIAGGFQINVEVPPEE